MSVIDMAKRYNREKFNVQVYQRPPPEGKGWKLFDGLRNYQQAKAVITSLGHGVGIIVRSDVLDFPYYVYVNEPLQRTRWRRASRRK